MKHNIFISYRRDDVASTVYRLADALKARYGAKRIIVDTDIPRGIKSWWGHLRRAMKTCGALFIVIGPRWLFSGGRGPKRGPRRRGRRAPRNQAGAAIRFGRLASAGGRRLDVSPPTSCRRTFAPSRCPRFRSTRLPVAERPEEKSQAHRTAPQRLRRALALAMGLAVCAAVAVGAVDSCSAAQCRPAGERDLLRLRPA